MIRNSLASQLPLSSSYWPDVTDSPTLPHQPDILVTSSLQPINIETNSHSLPISFNVLDISQTSSLPMNTTNKHNMIIRSKAGTFKLKVFMTSHNITLPKIVKKAFEHKGWFKSKKEEYDALMRNNIWELVPCPNKKMAIDNKWLFRIKELVD